MPESQHIAASRSVDKPQSAQSVWDFLDFVFAKVVPTLGLVLTVKNAPATTLLHLDKKLERIVTKSMVQVRSPAIARDIADESMFVLIN
jgi:hypothetical protein